MCRVSFTSLAVAAVDLTSWVSPPRETCDGGCRGGGGHEWMWRRRRLDGPAPRLQSASRRRREHRRSPRVCRAETTETVCVAGDSYVSFTFTV